MGLIEAYCTCISKYATFSGRARRSEYWFFYLSNLIADALLWVIGMTCVLAGAPNLLPAVIGLSYVYSLFALLPGLAVSVRRLHDTGHSGAHIFLYLIPLVGPIVLLIYMCRDSDEKENQYGPNPKATYVSPTYVNRVVEGGSLTMPPFVLPEESRVPAIGSGVRAPAVSKPMIRVSRLSGGQSGRPVMGQTVYVGRDPHSCQLVFSHTPGVSRVHCVLHTDGNTVEIKDLNSSYGTYLSNGKRLPANVRSRLHRKDIVYLGSRDAAVSVELV